MMNVDGGARERSTHWIQNARHYNISGAGAWNGGGFLKCKYIM